jgi:hypothetical protein
VAGPPPRAWGWFRPPHTADLGVAWPPPRPLGVILSPATPKTQIFFFLFLVSRPFRGSRTTPYGRYGGGSATPKPLTFFFVFFVFWLFGGGRTTILANNGVAGVAKGVAGHPLIFFRFLYFFF